MPIPRSVSRDELREALKPLCDLLGTSDRNFYDNPGMTIAADRITFVVPVSHESDPTRRASGVRAEKALPEHPHPQEHEREGAELAYMVTVEVGDHE